MTSPPEPPPSRRKLDTDEMIAILVAFGSIGTIFFWAIAQSDPIFNLSSMSGGLVPPAAVVPNLSATPAARVNPSISPVPQAVATPSAEVIVPDETPNPNVVPVPLPAQTPPAQVFSAPPQVAAFSDVPTTYWAAPYIAELTRNGVLEGFPGGTFQPDKPVTRAEFAGILSKAFNSQAKTRPSLSFQDIAPTYWASSAIETAVQTGFMNGYPGGVFRPDQPIPLSQLQVALVTGLNLPTPANADQIVGKYSDGQEVPKWAVDKVAAAIDAGFVSNYSDSSKLTPGRGATRADAAALVYQALAKQGKVKQVPK